MRSTAAGSLPQKLNAGIQPQAECAPLLLKIIFVLTMSVGGLGEWRVITSAMGGKPKALTVAVIVITVFYCAVAAKTANLKKVIKAYLLYLLLIAFILLWSVVIWIINFSDAASITRGSEKILYQFISITVAVCAVILFGLKSIDLFFISMCISNTVIMILEAMNFGLSASLSSFFHNIFTFGDAVGFARNIEIHELTFLFGMFLIYYVAFSPAGTKSEKQKKCIFAALSAFFFLAGVKRIAVIAVGLTFALLLLLKKCRRADKVLFGICVFLFVFYFFYLKTVRDGSFSAFMSRLGVDMMGRNYIWSLTNSYYRLSPTFLGLGFEAVDQISKEWYQSGVLQAAFMFHNDILKAFVELGFPGFTVWSLLQYVVYPVYFHKAFGPRVAVCYMSLLFYMSFTYMTDNTAFYYWCTMGLRLIPLAYAFSANRSQRPPGWQPPQKSEYKAQIALLLNSGS